MSDHEIPVGCAHRLGLAIGHPDMDQPCPACADDGIKPRNAIALTIHGPSDDPRASAAELYARNQIRRHTRND